MAKIYKGFIVSNDEIERSAYMVVNGSFADGYASYIECDENGNEKNDGLQYVRKNIKIDGKQYNIFF